MESAIGYIRVSSEEQVEGFSLDAQEERIRAYAKSQDYHLLEIYRDDGYSAKDLERPAVQRLLQEVHQNKFKIILVYKLDRFTRRLKDLTDILEYLTKHEVKFESVTEPFETKTAPGRLMLNVLGGFAQFEREVNAERVISSLKRRFDEGKWMTTAPFGYSLVDGLLIVNPAEAPLVKKTYQMYLDENIGTKEIANRLNDEGIRNRRGQKWRTGGIHRILTYPVYIGFTVWKGEKKPGIHEKIIEKGVYEAVQKRLKEKKGVPPRNHATQNVLIGLISCAKCGASMFVQKPGTKGKEKYRYYVCANACSYHSCSQKYIDGNLLEEKIFTQIRDVSKRPELIRDYVVSYKKEQTEEKAAFKKRTLELNRQITALKRKEGKIINWLAETLPDRETTKRMEQQLKGLSEKRKAFEEELLILEAKMKNLTLDEITAELISGYLERFDYYYERFTPAQRKLLLESVVQKVKVESKENIHLYMTLPLSPLGMPQNKSSKWHPVWRDAWGENKNQLIVEFTLSLHRP